MLKEFKGIRPLIEGLCNADYLNCVPTGSSIVERTNYKVSEYFPTCRYACRKKPDYIPYGREDEPFVDWYDPWDWENRNVKLVKVFQLTDVVLRLFVIKNIDIDRYDNHLYCVVNDIDKEGKLVNERMYATLLYRIRSVSEDDVTICVSGTKPRYIFVSVSNQFIVWINTSDTSTTDWSIDQKAIKLTEGIGVMIPPASSLASVLNNKQAMLDYDWNSYNARLTNRNASIEWYDNKLVFVDNNICWLSCTDPAQFISLAKTSPTANDVYKYSINNLWTSWYASSLSSDSLMHTKSAYGNLFFINNGSIEVWTRSGVESAPLNNVSNYVINLRILSTGFIQDTLYAVASENNKIGFYAITTQGVNKLSNNAVDAFIAKLNKYIIKPLNENDEVHISIGDGTNHIVFGNSCWYRLDYVKSDYVVYQSVSNDYAISYNGEVLKKIEICAATEHGIATYGDDEPMGYLKNINKYTRLIVDNQSEYAKRKSFAKLDVYGNFGEIGDDLSTLVAEGGDPYDIPSEANFESVGKDLIILQVSNTHGKTWGATFTRKPPSVGRYDAKIMFNGLGSGESSLLKLQWSGYNSYVIYGIDLKAV